MPSIEEARDILELGAHVPEGDLPKTPVEPNPDRKPGFDLSQVILQPAREHLLFVNSEGVAVGAVPLVDDLKSQQDRTIKHDLTLDMEKDALDFHLRVAGRAGKAYGLRFRVRFLDGAGQTLVRADHWNGDFAIKKLPPGAKAPLPPKPPPPRPEPAAEAAPAQAGKQ